MALDDNAIIVNTANDSWEVSPNDSWEVSANDSWEVSANDSWEVSADGERSEKLKRNRPGGEKSSIF